MSVITDEYIGKLLNYVPSTESEKNLKNHLLKEAENSKKLHQQNELLTEKLENLSQQFVILQKQLNERHEVKKVVETEQYFTDEDQLSKDTEWTRPRIKKLNKKRKADISLSPPMPEQPEVAETIVERKKSQPPPPIIVSKVGDFPKLLKMITDVIKKEEFKTQLLLNGNIKINILSVDSYRAVTDKLISEGFPWFSFENKQTRPFKVMVKKLHSSCSIEDIKKDLESQNLKVLDVQNKIGWKSKKPLDMFIISFDTAEKPENIYNIKYILSTKIEIEALKASKLVPQCKNCQDFGHTHNYCGRNARCVKCVENHSTSACKHTKEAGKAQCVNCGSDHPANYRGCQTAKVYQELRSKNIKQNTANVQHKLAGNGPPRVTSSTLIGKTYAEATNNSGKTTMPPKSENISKTLELILRKLESFDERLKKLEISKGAIPKSK